MGDTSSDESEVPRKKQKRCYKMFTDADYNPRNVHRTTRERWKKRVNRTQQIPIENSATGDLVGLKNQLLPPYASQASLDGSSRLYLESTDSSDAEDRDKSGADSSTDIFINCPSRSLNSHENMNENPACDENDEEYLNEVSARDDYDDDFVDDDSVNDDYVNYDSVNDNTNDDNNTVANINSHTSFQKMSHVTMFQEANLSTRDVSLMLMAYSIRFHLTYEARNSLFDMCKMFAGPRFEHWNTSKFVLNRLYDPPDEVIRLCFLCKECFEPLLPPVSKKKFKNCHVKCLCGLEYDLTSGSSEYVISVDLRYQMQILLEDEEIKNALLKGIRDIESEDNQSGDIRDVYDSQLYKRMQDKYSEASHLVSLNFSTDGAPVCNSEVKSFWPTQVIINELPPKLRFRYPILAGLSINTKELSPGFMNAYMKHFVDQCLDLTNNGLEIPDENGVPVKLTVVPLCCPVDSVARPLLQNRLQYSGYYGCSYCYEHGLYDHGAMRYPIREEDAVLRTHESHRQDCDQQKSMQQPTERGVKGFSVLLTLMSFDMVWGFPVDYLHAELLGVVKYLWNAWIERKVITANGIRMLNERLLNMTPPHEIHRLPRSMKVKAKWKASEWRSWLLFYSLVCLEDIISKEAFEHYALLVDSVFMLLQDTISEAEIRISEEKLLIFVTQCQEMYGTKVMTFNVHSLLHLVHSVRTAGPLWATSTFPFESAIFYLKRAITGPKGLYDQIAKRTLQRLSFNFTCRKLASSDTCLQFCKNLFAHPNCKDIVKTSSREPVLLGRLGVTDDGTQLFNRCIYKSSVFHSTKYLRSVKTNDTVVQLLSKEIGRIEIFRFKNHETHVDISLFTVLPDHDSLGVNHIKKVISNNTVITVPIESIHRKMVYMNANNCTYAARLPNTIEIQ